MARWIPLIIIIILVQHVSSRKHICGSGWQTDQGQHLYKDSFTNCETNPVFSNSNLYCFNKFSRNHVSIEQTVASQAKNKIKKYVHKCGRYIIHYRPAGALTLHQIDGDYMSIGRDCSESQAPLTGNPPEEQPVHTFCYIDVKEDEYKANKCPPHHAEDVSGRGKNRGLYYNAGSLEKPLQYKVRVCLCTTLYQGKCWGMPANRGHAHLTYDNVFVDEYDSVESQQMVSPNFDISHYDTNNDHYQSLFYELAVIGFSITIFMVGFIILLVGCCIVAFVVKNNYKPNKYQVMDTNNNV